MLMFTRNKYLKDILIFQNAKCINDVICRKLRQKKHTYFKSQNTRAQL